MFTGLERDEIRIYPVEAITRAALSLVIIFKICGQVRGRAGTNLTSWPEPSILSTPNWQELREAGWLRGLYFPLRPRTEDRGGY